MGQKVNPNVFRSNSQSNFWKSNYFSKNREDFSYYLHRTIAIRKYIDTLFERSGLIVNECFISYNHSILDIYISFYTTYKISVISNSFGSRILKFRSFIRGRQKKFKKSLTKPNKGNLELRIPVLYALENIFKKKLVEKNMVDHILSSKAQFYSEFKSRLLQSLSNYTKSSVIRIRLENLQNSTFQNLKRKNNYRLVIQKLRSYTRQSFFKEALEIFILISRGSGSAKLLSRFIAFQIESTKRHNNFLTFLKRTIFVFTQLKNSDLKGIKILISGRFNNAPRAKNRLIQFGRVPLQSIDAKIDYHRTDAFTPSGVFGIKVWLFRK
jgi:ribosomal protein S3